MESEPPPRKRRQRFLPGAVAPAAPDAQAKRPRSDAQLALVPAAAAAAENDVENALALVVKQDEVKRKRTEKMQRKRALGLRFEWTESFSWLAGLLASGDCPLDSIWLNDFFGLRSTSLSRGRSTERRIRYTRRGMLQR